MEGEDFYSVEETAKALRLTPERVRQMLRDGELEGVPPTEGGARDWRIPIRLIPGRERLPREEHPERRPEVTPPPPRPMEVAEEEAQSEASAQPSDKAADEPDEIFAVSGWTTTKQAAKVLGVSRRSVQGYVRRGLLEAREEGEGVNKRFFISIDSLNSLLDQRRREAQTSPQSASSSPEIGIATNIGEGIGDALRQAIERIEARTAEATELRIRLELTERAESTVRAELAEEARRRQEAERERDDLRRQLEALRRPREEPQLSTTPPEERAPSPATGGPRGGADGPPAPRTRRRPLWKRMFGA